jgi:cold shock CspA family protein
MPTGEVLFYKSDEPGRGYGYIIPDDGDDDRESNVWFGSKCLTKAYDRPERGDRVRYRLNDGNHKPSADLVQLLENLVTTIDNGEF